MQYVGLIVIILFYHLSVMIKLGRIERMLKQKGGDNGRKKI